MKRQHEQEQEQEHAGDHHHAEGEKEEEQEELHALLKASPRCWENPGVLGFNKLKARTTLGAFSSVHQARWGGTSTR